MCASGGGLFARIGAAFSSLSARLDEVQGDAAALNGKEFGEACKALVPLFGELGVALKFAGDDFVQKVEGLLERSPEGSTIGQQIDKDVADGKAKEKGSVTRDVLRITRGLDFIRAFVEALLAADPAEESLVDPAWKAYEAELMPYHAWVVQTAVRAGIYTVPYRSTFLQALGLSEAEGAEVGPGVVADLTKCSAAVRKIFMTKALGTDW